MWQSTLSKVRPIHAEAAEVFLPPPTRWREAKDAAEREGGGGGAAAAAAGSGGGAAGDDDEFAHPCPICLDNEDDVWHCSREKQWCRY